MITEAEPPIGKNIILCITHLLRGGTVVTVRYTTPNVSTETG